MADFLSNKEEVVNDVLWLARELLTQNWVLCGNTHRAGPKVTDTHHDAALCHQRSCREAIFLSTKQRCDDDITSCLHLAIRLEDNTPAQLVCHEDLLGFRKTKLPWNAGMLYG